MASFWDELKDAFKTDSQREEERRQELADALEAEKEITAELAGAMARTASPDLRHIDRSVPWRRDGSRP